MANGGYVIQVGAEKAAEAIVATPDKQGNPQGTQFKTYIRVGKHLILNMARVWGRRVIRGVDGKIKESASEVEFNTAGYKGEIEFLDWGEEGGYALTIRYLPQSRSLDFEYQENVQKITIRDDQWTHIQLSAGQNKFDPKKDDILVQFLKVIPGNRDSKSKNPNPDIKGYEYYEVTDEHVDKKRSNLIDASATSANFIKGLSAKPDQLRNLFRVLGDRNEFGNTDLLSGDAQIYATVLEYAYANPEDFNALIDEYKRILSEAFEKADSFKALDLTKDGHIAIEVKNKKELPFQGIEIKAKGNAMISWVLDHYLEDDVFKATQVFKDQVSKLK